MYPIMATAPAESWRHRLPASFAELLNRLGRDREVADQLGLEREDVKSMRRRDSVAPGHWPALEEAAANAGLEVDASDFARWRAEKAKARRDEQSAA